MDIVDGFEPYTDRPGLPNKREITDKINEKIRENQQQELAGTVEISLGMVNKFIKNFEYKRLRKIGSKIPHWWNEGAKEKRKWTTVGAILARR